MLFKRNNRNKVGIQEKTASFNKTSMKNKYDALKELEKGVPQKEVALHFGVHKKAHFPLGKETKQKKKK